MQTNDQPEREPFHAARFIKEIGRGVKGARGMPREEAALLYGAMLDGRVSDLELGAIVLAMRIKGESVEEIAGFMDAAERSFALLPAPTGRFAPVLIPSYNGARKLANLTPLLALLLAREGVPVLIHGVQQDPGRVTTAEILAELGIAPASSCAEMQAAFAAQKPCFMAIDTLAPKLAGQLALRRILGVRNSAHTLAKILQPFEGPALRLVSYTHPEYLIMLSEYFRSAAPAARGDAFLMRGTEGETVANANRAQQIDWFHAGEQTLLAERDAPTDELAPAPEGRDAPATADWILRALRGDQPVPAPVAAQAAHCLRVARALRADAGQ
jgi:anthranilate phosphoribosyltransferase